jgi:hypothetical protein
MSPDQSLPVVAYIWHLNLASATSSSLRWSKPTQWDYTTNVEELVRKSDAEAALAAMQARLDAAEEQLACVRQALPETLRNSVPSVAVATMAADHALLRHALDAAMVDAAAERRRGCADERVCIWQPWCCQLGECQRPKRDIARAAAGKEGA